MSERRPESVLRPGADGWELWTFPQKSAPKLEENPSPKSIAAAPKLLMALPSRSVIALPLWIAGEGNASELAELELSGRHLLRRDMEVRTIPVEQGEGRSLVLALAVGDDAPGAEFFPKARFFDVTPSLFDSAGADLVIWREFGDLAYGFFRHGHCVFFSASGESGPGPAFCSLVSRTALRLRAEEIIAGLPSTILLLGSFTPEDAGAVGSGLRASVKISPTTPPNIPPTPANVAPPVARAASEKREGLKRVGLFVGAAVVVYAILIAIAGIDLLARSITLRSLLAEEKKLAPDAEQARKRVTEWKEFQEAVNPDKFALDQLAAVASELPGDQVRLTQFSIEEGRILITGEAADISQAYQFLEQVKKSSVLQDYDWTSRQPQLAGKNKVRFEMEGARPDAKTGNE